jgi:hypothetical protein
MEFFKNALGLGCPIFILLLLSLGSCGSIEGDEGPADEPSGEIISGDPNSEDPNSEDAVENGIEITSFDEDRVYTNKSTLEVEGSCPNQTQVELIRNGEEDAKQTTPCTEGVFFFEINQEEDGTYYFILRAMDNGTVVAEKTFTWVRDTVPPSALQITRPKKTDPYVSAKKTVRVNGTCSRNAIVQVRGAESLQTACRDSGHFTLALDQRREDDGSFAYEFFQVDRADNASERISFIWVIDQEEPAVPTITSPEDSPVFTQEGSLTIEGECVCEPEGCVSLRGDFSQDASCEDETYRFDLTGEKEGEYSIEVFQTSAVGVSSSADTLIWVFDSTLPEPPSLLEPVEVPPRGFREYESTEKKITVRGGCETGGTVEMARSSDQFLLPAVLLTDSCDDGSYAIETINECNATLLISVYQQDADGNRSQDNTQLSWTRKCPNHDD